MGCLCLKMCLSVGPYVFLMFVSSLSLFLFFVFIPDFILLLFFRRHFCFLIRDRKGLDLDGRGVSQRSCGMGNHCQKIVYEKSIFSKRKIKRKENIITKLTGKWIYNYTTLYNNNNSNTQYDRAYISCGEYNYKLAVLIVCSKLNWYATFSGMKKKV